MIIGFRFTISDPTLMLNYQKYIKTREEGQERTKLIEVLEKSLAKVYGGFARGGSEKLVPDISIQDKRFTEAIAGVLGIGGVTESEVKLKRSRSSRLLGTPDIVGGRTSLDYHGTTIGESKINDIIKKAAYSRLGARARKGNFTERESKRLNNNYGKLIFDALQSDANLFNEFYRKSRTLNIARQVGNGPVEVFNLFFTQDEFTVPPFSLRYDLGSETLFLSLVSTFEEALLTELTKTTSFDVNNLIIDDFLEGFNSLPKFSGRTLKTRAAGRKNSFNIQVPTGGSIPTRRIKARINLKSNKQEDRRSLTISNLELTALVQKSVEDRMPRGPLRGPPLSETVLTYRTGEFVDSIRVIQDIKNKLVTYYYAPHYKVHERRGGRPPRFLLQASIRDTVKQLYGERFKIARGF